MNYISSLLLGLLISTTVYSQSKDYYKQLNKEGNYNQSLQLINKEIAQRPSDNELYLLKAETLCLIYQSKTDTNDGVLLTAYECLEKSNPKYNVYASVSSDVYNLMYRKAAIFMNAEDYKNANKWFKLTLKLHDQLQKNDPMLVFYTGIAAFNAEDYITMEINFNRLISSNFKLKEPYELLISYFVNHGKAEETLNTLKKSLHNSIKIDEEVLSAAIGIISKISDCSSLMQLYEKILSLYTENVVLNEIAKGYYLCNDTISAEKILHQAYKNNPKDTLTLMQLGILHYNRAIIQLQIAKDIINKDESQIEQYRYFKNLYIENMKASAFFLEQAINLQVKTRNAVVCLYESYKHLQRIEEMQQLKKKFSFLN